MVQSKRRALTAVKWFIQTLAWKSSSLPGRRQTDVEERSFRRLRLT